MMILITESLFIAVSALLLLMTTAKQVSTLKQVASNPAATKPVTRFGPGMSFFLICLGGLVFGENYWLVLGSVSMVYVLMTVGKRFYLKVNKIAPNSGVLQELHLFAVCVFISVILHYGFQTFITYQSMLIEHGSIWYLLAAYALALLIFLGSNGDDFSYKTLFVVCAVLPLASGSFWITWFVSLTVMMLFQAVIAGRQKQLTSPNPRKSMPSLVIQYYLVSLLIVLVHLLTMFFGSV